MGYVCKLEIVVITRREIEGINGTTLSSGTQFHFSSKAGQNL
jgi:hypothetical protein